MSSTARRSTREMRRFVDWIAAYTLSPPGMVARMLLRAPAAFDPEPWVEGLQLTAGEPERMTRGARARAGARRRRPCLDALRPGPCGRRLARPSSTGCSEQGVFEPVMIPPRPVVAAPDPSFAAAASSTPDQQRGGSSAARSTSQPAASASRCSTASPARARPRSISKRSPPRSTAGKQVLILLPEIALTQAFLERFQDRFGAKPAEWHSDVPPRMRERVWRQVAEGRVRVVAGARSALFLPFRELGLIVVDEEHDPAYKQEDRVFYNARDMAVVRARIGGFPVVLASATPSVESRVNAEQGRYGRVALPDALRRCGAARHRRRSTCAARRRRAAASCRPCCSATSRDNLERGEQSLLFLNRRGYAPLTLCRVCGHRFQCPDCSSWLVEHRFRGQLVCHHCGHQRAAARGLPGMRHASTISSPAAPASSASPKRWSGIFPRRAPSCCRPTCWAACRRLRLELEAIAKGEADIVIGTQLVAKGHNFPDMTLVGVVDADLGLANGDPRAAERTFQLLSQVTGRAGRTGKKSVGLLQTYQPDHPVMRAIVSGDAESFYEKEIAERERARLPPFGRLAGIIVSAADARRGGRRMRAGCGAPRRDGRRPARARAGRGAAGADRRPPSLPPAGPGRAALRHPVASSAPCSPPGRSRAARCRVQVDIDPQSFL